jgi:hypothetical protein
LYCDWVARVVIGVSNYAPAKILCADCLGTVTAVCYFRSNKKGDRVTTLGRSLCFVCMFQMTRRGWMVRNGVEWLKVSFAFANH